MTQLDPTLAASILLRAASRRSRLSFAIPCGRGRICHTIRCDKTASKQPPARPCLHLRHTRPNLRRASVQCCEMRSHLMEGRAQILVDWARPLAFADSDPKNGLEFARE